MDNDVTNTAQDSNGPPPAEAPHQKGTPHHLESRLSQLDPELRELVEKTIADKVNAERNSKVRNEELAKTQQKLTQLQQEKEAAERAKMEEQGKYKELAEQEASKRVALEEKLFKVEVQSNLDRELMSNGALDSEMISAAIMSKYSDELKANPASATALVARLKEEKPLLFKSNVKSAPPPQSTGQSQPPPPPGAERPTSANATDKKNGKFVMPMSEVEKAFDEAFSQNPLF